MHPKYMIDLPVLSLKYGAVQQDKWLFILESLLFLGSSQDPWSNFESPGTEDRGPNAVR